MTKYAWRAFWARPLLVCAALVAFGTWSRAADNNFPTPGNAVAPGAVNMCLNGSGQAVACSSAFPLPTALGAGAAAIGSVSPLVVVPTDRGGTITAGLTSQTVAAANASRKAMHCENPTTATEPLYFAVVGAATINGAGNWADVAPGGSTTFSYNGTVVQTAITVNATTTGHRFICTEMQ